jgi:hypothetical protein
MNFDIFEQILEEFYEENRIISFFDNNRNYLEEAFYSIFKLWEQNFEKIEDVKYIVIAEAPLWGKEKKYIYNPNINNSQFFTIKNLSILTERSISNKLDFINSCNEMGLLFIDVSPFALNHHDTRMNYSKTRNASLKLNRNQYRVLTSKTLPYYFEKKLELANTKKQVSAKVFIRYARIKNNLEDYLIPLLNKYNYTQNSNGFDVISKRGGMIDIQRLKTLMNK